MQNRSKIQNEQKPCRIHGGTTRNNVLLCKIVPKSKMSKKPCRIHGGTTRNNILLCKIVPKSKMSKNHAESMGAQLEIMCYYAKSFQNPKLAKTMQNPWGHNSK